MGGVVWGISGGAAYVTTAANSTAAHAHHAEAANGCDKENADIKIGHLCARLTRGDLPGDRRAPYLGSLALLGDPPPERILGRKRAAIVRKQAIRPPTRDVRGFPRNLSVELVDPRIDAVGVRERSEQEEQRDHDEGHARSMLDLRDQGKSR